MNIETRRQEMRNTLVAHVATALAFAAMVPIAARAEPAIEEWKVVGQHPVCADVESAVQITKFLPEVKAKFVEMIKKTTMPRADLITLIKNSSASQSGKDAALKIVNESCFSFFASEYFRGSRKLAADIMNAFNAKMDKSIPYRVELLKNKDTFAWLTFGSEQAPSAGTVGAPPRLSRGTVEYTGPDDACPIRIYETDVNGKQYFASLCVNCNNIGFNWKRGEYLIVKEKETKPPAPAGCPDGVKIVANVWSLSQMPAEISFTERFGNSKKKHLYELRKEIEDLVEAAKKRDSRGGRDLTAYQADDVSRTLGARLRKEVEKRAATVADLHVYARDPQNATVLKDLGVLNVQNGIGTMRFLLEQGGDPRANIIETAWPKDFLSPTVSNVTDAGEMRQLWLFPGEWKKAGGGEWCVMNIHGIVP